MRPRLDGPAGHSPLGFHPGPEDLREAPGVASLFLGVFRRDLLAFFPQAVFEPIGDDDPNLRGGPNFRLVEGDETEGDRVELYGVSYRLAVREGEQASEQELRLIRAMGAVLGLRYQHLFQLTSSARLELYRGGSEDHYIAAFVEPWAYSPLGTAPSRIAAAIQTLRTAALSTYENHRVSTGALLVGTRDDPHHASPPTSPDALPYGVELTGLKSIHRLCDGERTLFLVDRQGKLAGIVDAARWAEAIPEGDFEVVPCARTYAPHARATREGGHLCVVLSANQEIKLFDGGVQAFAFTHGRWRLLDPRARFDWWRDAVADPSLARALFQAALNLAEERHGALFVVLDEPARAIGQLLAPGDVLAETGPDNPPTEITPRDPLARRALHYLARGRRASDLDPAVLEALASLDGALVLDRSGKLVAFGAILRHDASDLPNLAAAEGARTTAALAASRFGTVLKVSEDGVISCFLAGARAWDL